MFWLFLVCFPELFSQPQPPLIENILHFSVCLEMPTTADCISQAPLLHGFWLVLPDERHWQESGGEMGEDGVLPLPIHLLLRAVSGSGYLPSNYSTF